MSARDPFEGAFDDLILNRPQPGEQQAVAPGMPGRPQAGQQQQPERLFGGSRPGSSRTQPAPATRPENRSDGEIRRDRFGRPVREDVVQAAGAFADLLPQTGLGQAESDEDRRQEEIDYGVGTVIVPLPRSAVDWVADRADPVRSFLTWFGRSARSLAFDRGHSPADIPKMLASGINMTLGATSWAAEEMGAIPLPGETVQETDARRRQNTGQAVDAVADLASSFASHVSGLAMGDAHALVDPNPTLGEQLTVDDFPNLIRAERRDDGVLQIRQTPDQYERRLSSHFGRYSEYWNEQLTPAMRESLEREWVIEGEDGLQIGPAVGDVWSWMGGFLQSAPFTVASMAPPALIANRVYRSAMKRELARNVGETAAQRTAQREAMNAATASGMVTQGILIAGSAGQETMERIMDMPIETLQLSPMFRRLAGEGLDEDEIRARIAQDASRQAALEGGGFGAVVGTAFSRFLGRLVAHGGTTRMKEVARGAFIEMPTEFLQEGGEAFFSNKAVQEFANVYQPLMEGVWNRATAGAAIGAMSGGGMAAVAYRHNASPEERQQMARAALASTINDARSFGVDSMTIQDILRTARAQPEGDRIVYAVRELIAEVEKAQDQRAMSLLHGDEGEALEASQPNPGEAAATPDPLRFQFMRDRLGATKQMEIHPLTQHLFIRYLRPRLPEQLNIRTLEQYLAKYPNASHIALARASGNEEWTAAKVGTPEEIAPGGSDALIARRVESFDSAEAQEWAAIQQEEGKKEDPSRVRSTDTLLVAIAKLGGLSTEEAIERGIDPADIRDARGWSIKRPFVRGSRSFDDLAQTLDELGFPVRDEMGRYDPHILEELVRQEIMGEPVYTHEGLEQVTGPEALAAQQEQAFEEALDRPAAADDADASPQSSAVFERLAAQARQYDEDAVDAALEMENDEAVVDRLVEIIAEGKAASPPTKAEVVDQGDSDSPIAPAGPRWNTDRGAMPGEPFMFLDQNEDTGDAVAALVEKEIEGRGVVYEGYMQDGRFLGQYSTVEEAAKQVEKHADRLTEIDQENAQQTESIKEIGGDRPGGMVSDQMPDADEIWNRIRGRKDIPGDEALEILRSLSPDPYGDWMDEFDAEAMEEAVRNQTWRATALSVREVEDLPAHATTDDSAEVIQDTDPAWPVFVGLVRPGGDRTLIFGDHIVASAKAARQHTIRVLVGDGFPGQVDGVEAVKKAANTAVLTSPANDGQTIKPVTVDDDDSGEYARLKVAFFDDDNETYIQYLPDEPDGKVHIVSIYAEGGPVRGSDMVAWLASEYDGKPIVANEVAPGAEGFWNGLEDRGVIEGWESDAYQQPAPQRMILRFGRGSSAPVASVEEARAILDEADDFDRQTEARLEDQDGNVIERFPPRRTVEGEASPAESTALAPAGGTTAPTTTGMEIEFDGRRFPVESIDDAQAKWDHFVEKSGAGSSELGGDPVIYQDGKPVARISYNGRVWEYGDGKYSPDGREIRTKARPDIQIGKNTDGDTIYERPDGTRFIRENFNGPVAVEGPAASDPRLQTRVEAAGQIESEAKPKPALTADEKKKNLTKKKKTKYGTHADIPFFDDVMERGRRILDEVMPGLGFVLSDPGPSLPKTRGRNVYKYTLKHGDGNEIAVYAQAEYGPEILSHVTRDTIVDADNEPVFDVMTTKAEGVLGREVDIVGGLGIDKVLDLVAKETGRAVDATTLEGWESVASEDSTGIIYRKDVEGDTATDLKTLLLTRDKHGRWFAETEDHDGTRGGPVGAGPDAASVAKYADDYAAKDRAWADDIARDTELAKTFKAGDRVEWAKQVIDKVEAGEVTYRDEIQRGTVVEPDGGYVLVDVDGAKKTKTESGRLHIKPSLLRRINDGGPPSQGGGPTSDLFAEQESGRIPGLQEVAISKGAAANRFQEGDAVQHPEHGYGLVKGPFKSDLRVKFGDEVIIVDARHLTLVESPKPAAAPESAPAAPAGDTVVGQNREGETVYQDKDGVRHVVVDGVKVQEKVTMAFTNEGRSSRIVPTVDPSTRDRRFMSSEETRAEVGAIPDPVAAANEQADTNPSEAQKESGNYKKGHVRLHGLDFTIETPAGGWRTNISAEAIQRMMDDSSIHVSKHYLAENVLDRIRAGDFGSAKKHIDDLAATMGGGEFKRYAAAAWAVKMKHPYGYIKRTNAADGEQVDVFLGPNAASVAPLVYVIDQVDQNGAFDEHKIMFGFPDEDAAVKGYASAFSAGWKGFGGVSAPIGVDQFKLWLEKGKQTGPVTPTVRGDSTPGAFPLIIEDLSEKAIIVRGDTRTHKDTLKGLKGLWNRKYTGWIFPKKRRDTIQRALEDRGLVAPVGTSAPRPAEESSAPIEGRVQPPKGQMGIAERNIAKLLEQLDLASAVLQGESWYGTISNSPFMDLVIERQPYPTGDRLILTHYFEQNGDLVLDAEMVFLLTKDGHLKLAETATQNPVRGGESRGRDGSFANMFSRNLLDQGFGKGTLIQVNGQPTAAQTAGEQAEATQGGTYGTVDAPNRLALAQAFRGEFAANRHFKTIVEARQYAGELLQGKVEAGSAAAKVVDEAVELGMVMAARRFVQLSERVVEAYDRLVVLNEQLPTLGVRTSTSVEQQAYSTPIPLSFVASRLAGISYATSVLEPSAGNGALLIEAAQENTRANELNADRAEALRAQGFNPTTVDAVQMRPRTAYSVVIANPPFGVIRDANGDTIEHTVQLKHPDGTAEAFTTTEIDHAIAINSLSAMADDGSAVLIVGGVNQTDKKARQQGYNGMRKRDFYLALYRNYNVVDHFTVAGKLYAKQGAGWPVDVIVIRGRKPSELALPAKSPPRILNNWTEVREVLSDEPNYRGKPHRLGAESDRPARPAIRDGSVRSDGGSGADSAGTAESGGISDGPGGTVRGDATTRPAAGARPGGATGQAGPRGDRPRPSSGQGGGVWRPGGVQQSGGVGTAVNARPARPVPAKPKGGRPGAASSTPSTVGGMGRPADGRTASVAASEGARQAAYQPSSKATPVGTLVPTNMASAVQQSLESLRARVGDLDAFVAEKLGYEPDSIAEYFSAEQVDALAMAINNMDNGSGFIIGDQTGIGKGRVVAGAIVYAWRTGRNPIFVTEKPNLYKDIYRDLVDIGVGMEAHPVMTNAGEKIPLDDEGTVILRPMRGHNDRLSRMARDGNLGDFNIVFTTYAQMSPVRQRLTPRHDFLTAISNGALLIMDESHNAGGTETIEEDGKRQRNVGLSRARFARELVGHASSVMYSSATYAKRPEVMDLYATTDMRLAVDDPSKLPVAIHAGGIPLQQVVASMLAEAGQYIRRERDFAGIDYHTKSTPVNAEVAESVSAAFAEIVAFDDIKQVAVDTIKEGLLGEGSVMADGSTGQPGVHSTNFTSLMHNLVDQMLLGLKAVPAVDQAVEALRAGQKPIMTVSNTMGAFIEEVVQNTGLMPGDPVNMDFGALMLRYLDRSREITIKEAGSRQGRRHWLTDAELGPEGVQQYNYIRELIGETDFSAIPVSPIDYMRDMLAKHGYKFDEITGRKYGIDYSDPANPVLRKRSQADTKSAGRNRILAEYNSGDLDGLIINQSGATGLSAHASERFKDQRMRHMFIVQPEKNIDTHMQLLGRINRTGQVVLPVYTQMVADIPAEKRPAAVLAKKMASLNANTTASKSGALEARGVVDFMNQYGDMVVTQLMAEDEDTHELLGNPLGERPDPSSPNDDAIRKVTGRLPLLKVSEQERIYNLIESEYLDLIARLEAQGQSPLEAKTLDLDATPVSQAEIFVGNPASSSPFARGAMAEVMDIKRIGKPMTLDEVRKAAAESLEVAEDSSFEEVSRKGIEQARSMLSAVRGEVTDYLAAQTARGEKYGTTAQRMSRVGMDIMTNLLPEYHVGKRVNVTIAGGDTFGGIVTSIHRAKGAVNPASPRAWRMTIAVSDASRQFTVPFVSIRIGAMDPSDDQIGLSASDTVTRHSDDFSDSYQISVDESFEDVQTVSRERRVIITGNLLAGYGQVAGQRGSIINFTDSSGNVRQGIIMPRKYTVDDLVEQAPVVMPDVDGALAVLGMDREKNIELHTSEGGLTVKPGKDGNSGGIELTTSKARATGGQYFLNHALRAAIGQDFVSSGARMRVSVPQDRVRTVLDTIFAEFGPLQATQHKDDARRTLGMPVREKDPRNGMIRRSVARDEPKLSKATQKLVDNLLADQKKPQIETPEFRRWFGDSKVVKKGTTARDVEDLLNNPQPARVYHATVGDYDIPRTNVQWFAEDPLLAHAFIGGNRRAGDKPKPGSNIRPVYLSIQNPLDFAAETTHYNAFFTVRKLLEFAGVTNIKEMRKIGDRMEAEAAPRRAEWAKDHPPGFVGTPMFGEVGFSTDPSMATFDAWLDRSDMLWRYMDDPRWIQVFRDLGFDGVRTVEGQRVNTRRIEGRRGMEKYDEYPISITWAAFSREQVKSAVGNRGTFDPADPDIRRHSTWHGSRHLFYEFDMDKIGTGEGAQAFGWGMYVAENQEVGQVYRKVGMKYGQQYQIHGLPRWFTKVMEASYVPHLNPLESKRQRMYQDIVDQIGRYGLDEAIEHAKARIAFFSGPDSIPRNATEKEKATITKQNAEVVADKELEIKTYDQLREAGIRVVENDGFLYEVEIADDAIPTMLSYDDFIKDQPQIMKHAEALEQVIDQWYPESMRQRDNPDRTKLGDLTGSELLNLMRDVAYNHMNTDGQKLFLNDVPQQVAQAYDLFNTGQQTEEQRDQMITNLGFDPDAYRDMSDIVDPDYEPERAVSMFLKRLGVRGIRYFDGNSRRIPIPADETKEGPPRTNNFVLFDTADLRIKSINGRPVTKAQSDEIIDYANDSRHSRETESGRGIGRQRVQAVVDRIKRKWKGKSPDIRVIDSANQLPHALQSVDGIRASDGLFDVRERVVYLFANNIKSEQGAERVLLHEVRGHYRLREFFGDDIVPLLTKVALTYGKSGLRDIAQRWDLDLNNRNDLLTAAEEKVSMIAETGENPTLLARIVTWVREWLRARGFKLRLSDSEIRVMVERMNAPLERGTSEPTGRRRLPGSSAQDREVRFSKMHHDEVIRRQTKLMDTLREGRPIEWAFRLPGYMLGSYDSRGVWKAHPQLKGIVTGAVDFGGQLLKGEGPFQWLNPVVSVVRNDIIQRYGLDEKAAGVKKAVIAGITDVRDMDKAYAMRDQQRQNDKRAIMLKGREIAEGLRGMSLEESKVLHAILTGKTIPDQEWAKISAPIRQALDELGQTAVDVGLLSEEAYQRNRGTWMHRVYMKHETDASMLAKFTRDVLASRRKKLQGDAFKGRGISYEVRQDQLTANLPRDWWGRQERAGKGDRSLLGTEFIVLDRMSQSTEGVEAIPGVPAGEPKKPRTLQRVFWPADEPIPAKFAGWDNRGSFEVRAGGRGNKFIIWRDYTDEERLRMGEIVDARYTIVKSFMTMAHDLSTGKFFKDIAENPDWSRSGDDAPGSWTHAIEGRRKLYTEFDWVKVPESKIAGSNTYKWGALAGRFVRSDLWRDINELDRMQKIGWWKEVMKQWKLNKTARNPVVHMNNIMSNLMLMDMADIRGRDLVRGIVSYIKEDEHYQDALAHGAFGSDFISQEIKRGHLDPILKEMMNENMKAGGNGDLAQQMGLMVRVANAAWEGLKKADDAMVKLYQLEDEVFRMATYMRELSVGSSPEMAANRAREQFLNYDIRAPWVNMLRETVLPFISYTYRAVPVVAKSLYDRPYKLAKYITLGYMIPALFSMIAGDDEDDVDEAYRVMRDQVSGYTWIGTPRMIRMPFNDEHGNPIYLDIRRWIPAGDVFDFNQGQSAIPIPAPLQFGGPLMIAAEVFLNKQAFTGQEIYNPLTDDAGDRASNVGGFLYRSLMPSAPWVPGSWYWDKIGRAATGARDPLMREYNIPLAISSSVGVKLEPIDVALNMQYRMWNIQRVENALNFQARTLARDRARGIIDEATYRRELSAIQTKLRQLAEDARYLTTGERD